jgi:hypothetical protein
LFAWVEPAPLLAAVGVVIAPDVAGGDPATVELDGTAVVAVWVDGVRLEGACRWDGPAAGGVPVGVVDAAWLCGGTARIAFAGEPGGDWVVAFSPEPGCGLAVWAFERA